MENRLVGKYVPIAKLNELPRGTIIRHALDERSFVVTANYGSRVTAVATVDVTNISEWLRFDDSEGGSGG